MSSDSSKPRNVKEAVYLSGGGSAEFRYRLGVELGLIEPPAKCGCPYWWDFEANEGRHHENCGGN